jgi:hypothetical protein
MVSCYVILYKIYSITCLLQNAENVEFNEICLAKLDDNTKGNSGSMMLVFYVFLDVSLYVCILYVQGVCMVLMLMVLMLMVLTYSFPRHVYLLFFVHTCYVCVEPVLW